MKPGLLFLCLMISMNGFCQLAELGLSGGIALHTGAGGSIYYKAEQMNAAPVAALTLVKNMDRYSDSKLTWQTGVRVNYFSALKNKTSRTYSYFNDTIGNDGSYFRYANYMLSAGALVLARYKLSPVSYAYGGFSGGLAGTRNESNRRGADFAGQSVTYKAPDGGIGFYAGLAGGFTYRLSPRIALNADLECRYHYFRFSVDDITYPGGTRFSYTTLVFPVTAGIRYRIGFPKRLNSGTGKLEIAEPELENAER
jgi:hypothetical protein